MAKEEALKAFNSLSEEEKKGFTKEIVGEHGKDLLENYLNSKRPSIETEVRKAVTSEIHTSYDEQLFNLTGKRKAHDQKTYDFLTEVYNTSNVKEVEKLQKQLKALEESKGGDAEHVQSLKAEIERIKAEHNETVQGLESKHLTFVKDGFANQLKSGLNFEGYDERVKNHIINGELSKVLPGMEIKDGKPVFKDENGGLILGDDQNPITIEAMKAKVFGEFMSKEENKGGGGANPSIKTGFSKRDSTGAVKLNIPSGSWTTPEEFMAIAERELSKQGVSRSNDDYQKAIDEAWNDNGLNELNIF